MDEILLKQLIRQLKIINFWISLFGILIVTTLVILGFLLYKIITFTHDTANKLDAVQTHLQQDVDVKAKLCNSSAQKILGNSICQ